MQIELSAASKSVGMYLSDVFFGFGVAMVYECCGLLELIEKWY